MKLLPKSYRGERQFQVHTKYVNRPNLGVLILIVSCILYRGAVASDIQHSPNRTFSVEVVDSPRKSLEENDRLLIVRKGGKIITRVPTIGFLLNVFWASNGKYVAINNRTANSGDYLWVISVSDGTVIRKPFDPISNGRKKDKNPYPELKASDIFREFVIATGWTDANDLNIEESYYYKNISSYIVRNLTCAIAAGRIIVKKEVCLKKQRSGDGLKGG